MAGSNCWLRILHRRGCRPAKGTLCASAPSTGWLLLCFSARRDQKPVSLLRDSGIALLRSGEASVVFCAMPNGLRGKGSHTHCDKLSVILRLGPNEVFCDSGSRCYTRSAERRNLDRSTRAHNTLMVDEADQNTLSPIRGCFFSAATKRLFRQSRYWKAVYEHPSGLPQDRRRAPEDGATEPSCLEVLDEVSGAGEHLLDLRYVLGPEWRVSSEMMTGETVSCVIAGPRRLTLQCEAQSRLALSVLPAEISREYGAGLPTSCIRIHTTAYLPAKVQTRVQWD